MQQKVSCKFFIWIVLFFTFCLGSPIGGLAEELEVNLGIEPVLPENQNQGNEFPNIDLSMQPSQTQVIQINLSNHSDKQVTIIPAMAVAMTQSDGQISYVASKDYRNEDMTLDIRDIVNFSSEEILIEPQSSELLEVTVIMPEQGFDGLLAGGIYFDYKKEEDNSASKGTGVSNEINYLIGFRLTMGDQEISPDISLSSLELNADKVINLKLKNSQKVFLKDAVIETQIISKKSGKVIESQTEKDFSFAPDSSFIYSFSLDSTKQRYQAGEYLVKTKVSNDQGKWQTEGSFTLTEKKAKKINELNNNVGPNYLFIAASVVIGLIIVLAIVLIRKKFFAEMEKEKE